MKTSLKRVIYFVVAAEIILGISHLMTYFGKFDGDPIIHMSFAENASKGAWFRFNAGEPISGVTSFLWMFVGAAGWKIGGIEGCLLVYDGLILLSWIGGAIILTLLVNRWCGNKEFSLLAGAVFLGYPGIAANGLTGMENMTFAFLLFLFLYLCSLRYQEDTRGTKRLVPDIILGAILGLSLITRPEGLLLVFSYAVFEAFLIWSGKRRRESRIRFGSLALILAIAALIALPAWGFHYAVTHQLVPGSGIARLMHARRLSTTIHLFGPLWLYPRTIARMATYLPVSAGLGIAALLAIRRSAVKKETAAIPRDPAFLFSMIVTFVGILFYSLVTGAVHTNRYTIWIVGISTAVASSIASSFFKDKIAKKNLLSRAIILLGISWMLVFNAVEGAFRVKRGDSAKLRPWKTVVEAVQNRKKQTDDLIDVLKKQDCYVENQKVGILLQEIQARICYDDRVVIYSGDGRTQSLSYFKNGCPDLTPLLNDKKVMVLMENINKGTTEGCIRDKEGLDMVKLFESDGLIEIDNWKKAWLKSSPLEIERDRMNRKGAAAPILIKKVRPSLNPS